MIRRSDITRIGSFLKPHGIKGEISAQTDFDIDLSGLRCIVVEIDGIPVPFFISGIRTKSSTTVLLSIDGFNSEQEVKELVGLDIYALNEDVEACTDEEPADGFYVADIIGYDITDEHGTVVGTIADFDDSIENVILLVDTATPAGNNRIFIPLAEEYVLYIDAESQTIGMNLPEGLLDINKTDKTL